MCKIIIPSNLVLLKSYIINTVRFDDFY